MNHQPQRIWQTLLAVRSLDELDGALREDVETLLAESPALSAAWERSQGFDRQVVEHLLSDDFSNSDEFSNKDVSVEAQLVALQTRVFDSLRQVALRQEIDTVHRLDELSDSLPEDATPDWVAARRWDDSVAEGLLDVHVPEGLQSRLLATLANVPTLQSVETADGETADGETANNTTGPVEVVSRSWTVTRRRWSLAGGAVVAAGLVWIMMSVLFPPVPNGTRTVEGIAAYSVQLLDKPGELAWIPNAERLAWRMPDKAAHVLDESSVTFFRRREAGHDVYLVRLAHPLAQELQQRLPFRDIPTSGGWHVGAWSDGTNLFLACSKRQESLEFFRADIQPI
jgi:hypothetical protein